MMIAISALDQAAHAAPRRALSVPAMGAGREWVVRQIQPEDVAAIGVLFRQLHTFNTALDPRFALSAKWEAHFERVMHEALRGSEVLCLIARETDTGRPCGFALAGVHRDSGMWRYREWVEVEDLYVDEAWRGSGLADALLARLYEWAESVGQSVVQLYVTANNERAINFYRREGFSQTQAIMRRVLDEAGCV